MKMKILSPAGDMESLKAAIFNGADEIYLGISGFNARNNIEGFSLQSLKEAVDFAHFFGIKIHLAINILFSDSELIDAVNTIVKSYNLGVDAFIIQDLGLAYILHTNHPEIELHASTQMGICNLEGAKYISKFGFKRIVLARETPINEIKRIKENLNIEIEYFAQGALCVSFSGNCYLSSYLCDASGNRGKCKQLCRLPYTLSFNGKKIKDGFLLSAKDFNMLHNLQDLQDAGVDVIKIEGRARRPFYVATATRIYRAALDNQKFNENELELAFTRNYTPGYFNGNSNIISSYKNHIGIPVGSILKVNRGKKFNEIIFTSNKNINPKSTFKVFDKENEICTFTAYSIKKLSNNKYSTTTTQNIPSQGRINLIVDEEYENQILSQIKKLNAKIQIYAKVDLPISATITCRENTINVLGDICQPAKLRPISEKDILDSFAKSELINPTISINLDNVFLTKKQINEFRRNCFNQLYLTLTKNHRSLISPKQIPKPKPLKPLTDFTFVTNFKTLPKEKNIIYSPETYLVDDIESFINKCLQNRKTAILDTPNFLTEQDIVLIKNIISKTNITILANNYATLTLTDNLIIGAGLNIYNSISANILNKEFLTAEQDFGSKIDFAYMTLRHCPMKEHLNAACNNCPFKNGYIYEMQNGKKLNLVRKKLSSCTFYLTKQN